MGIFLRILNVLLCTRRTDSHNLDAPCRFTHVRYRVGARRGVVLTQGERKGSVRRKGGAAIRHGL